MKQPVSFFSSRWGLMLAMLGMAVGTGNIWRFPRIVAANGGGSFLVAWVVFLLAWSVPLIVLEFALGKALRKGTLGAMRHLLGERWTWLGAWISWTAAGIGFYYAVVMGWTLRYLLAAVSGRLAAVDHQVYWSGFVYQPAVLIFHGVAVAMAVAVVWGGVSGIERAAKVLMPVLVVLVVVLAVRAVTLDGAAAGLDFLFAPHWSDLLHARVWLEALTQNAWDTGAGWGLVLTYAIYTRANEDTNLNGFLLAFGNNAISLLSGILVLCTVFAFTPAGEAAAALRGQSNEGLTFIWIPQLFNQMPGGRIFMSLFFLALVFAAWTSLVSLFELIGRAFEELGFSRRRAMPWIGLVVFLLGVPSALSAKVFTNQDFVWSVSLMISGLCFAGGVLRYGVARFRREFVNNEWQDLRIGRWWEWSIRLVVVEAVVLIGWWFWQVRSQPAFAPDGVGMVLLQWAIVGAVFASLNGWFVRRMRLAGSGRPE